MKINKLCKSNKLWRWVYDDQTTRTWWHSACLVLQWQKKWFFWC